MICFSLLLGVSLPAVAATDVQMPVEGQLKINEYDLYSSLQTFSEEALLSNGYSEEFVDTIKNTDYNDLVRERALLPDATLAGMGYTVDEILLLRNYNGTEAEARAISGTLTAEINCTSASVSRYTIEYVLEWDHSPVVLGTDSMGMRWRAFGDDGDNLDVSAFSSTASINYYLNSALSTTKSYSASDSCFASETNFNALTCEFPLVLSYAEGTWYALSGKLKTSIERDSQVTRNILYIKVCGVYGHSVVNLGAPSPSFSVGDDAFGLSFGSTIGVSVDNLGIKKYKIYTNKTKVAIDA